MLEDFAADLMAEGYSKLTVDTYVGRLRHVPH